MAQNKIKYTGLTYDNIQSQITDLIASDTDFDRFRESAIAQTLIEIFTGTTDIVNYYLNRRAEECYFDTAQLRSSVISLSRMFGYVMNRKEPARAKLRMIVKGNIEDNQIQIPYYSKFSYSGDNFVLINTMTYRIPDSVYNLMDDKSEIIIDTDSYGNSIEIAQGTIKEKVINGTTNPQVGAPFQIYKIEDESFSNSYGDKDIFYNNVTQVYVGDNKSDENRFDIDRRSLLNWETIDTSDLSTSKAVCVVRTTPDGYVEILFGDGDPNKVITNNSTGGFARKGAITRQDNIYVQYLSTKGKSSNKYGVIGEKVNFSGTIYNSKGEDITSKITFELLSNVTGGADDESTDSIKYSSPKIYYSLDRLVSLDDYLAYLKSLNSPINVKNAIAWGEQQERDRYNAYALKKMFNVAFFSIIGSLYDTDSDPHIAKTGNAYDGVVLDLNYNPYQFQTQGYFNVFVMQEMVNQLNRYRTLTTFREISGNNFSVSGTTTEETVATNIKNSIKTNFPNGKATIDFSYTSDSTNKVSNITATGSVDISGLNDATLVSKTGNTYLKALASKVNDALLNFKDARGNKSDNDNFNKQAFIGRWSSGSVNSLIKWDAISTDTSNGTTYSYRVRFNESEKNNGESPSPCYITKIDTNGTSLMGIMGLSGLESIEIVYTTQENEMNGKIVSVINNLNQRSQVNVKNIYVSPIIQRFNLEGEIVIKALYDREEVKREITNQLYKWFDINADFNEPIYLSNIVEIIESNSAVLNANVKLVPEDITKGPNNTANLYYDPDPTTNKIYTKYTVNGVNKVANEVNNYLANYLGSDTSVTEKEYRNFFTSTSISKTLYSNDMFLKNDINERTFFNNFAGGLYTRFKKLKSEQTCSGTAAICGGEPNYGRFIGLDANVVDKYGSDIVHDSVLHTDFEMIMEQIHKDLSYIIKLNMIDSYGNIDREVNSNNEYVRGGYSLGSEIVQIELNPVGSDDNALLTYRYK